MEKFFIEISTNQDGDKLLIQTLFEFTKKVNNMSPEDLISFFQALRMLKDTQPMWFFKPNPIRINITNTQVIVIEAMRRRARNDLSLARMFNGVISDTWINDRKYHISEYQ